MRTESERLRQAGNLLAAAIDRGQERIDNEIGGNVRVIGLDDSSFGLRLLALLADAIGNRQFVMARPKSEEAPGDGGHTCLMGLLRVLLRGTNDGGGNPIKAAISLLHVSGASFQ